MPAGRRRGRGAPVLRRGASQEWLDALAPLGTGWRKPFLEAAPAVIVVFKVHRSAASPLPYYVKESVGIAVGLLVAALHQAGLATLTHTPSPMRWINEVLGRPPHERPFMLIPVGYPAPGAQAAAAALGVTGVLELSQQQLGWPA